MSQLNPKELAYEGKVYTRAKDNLGCQACAIPKRGSVYNNKQSCPWWDAGYGREKISKEAGNDCVIHYEYSLSEMLKQL